MSLAELEKEKNLMTPERKITRKITRTARRPEGACARKPHAGICEGGAGQPVSLP